MKKFYILLLLLSIACNKIDDNKCIDSCEIKSNKVKNEIKKNKKYTIYTATWCSHCRKEYKHIQKIYDVYKESMDIEVYVNASSSKKEIDMYFRENGYNFPYIYDENNEFANKHGLEYIPAIFEYNKLLDISELNLMQYTKEVFSSVELVDKNNKTYKASDLLENKTKIVYGAPWCKDCRAYIPKLKNENILYIIDTSKFSYEDYKNYDFEGIDAYYVKNKDFRDKFNIKWIPSVAEVEEGKINSIFKEVR